MSAVFSLVRLDLTRLLWRPRTIGVLAYLGASSWLFSTFRPDDVRDKGLVGIAITEIIPVHYLNPWLMFTTFALPLVILSAAVVIEERSSGGTWMTVHRCGGIRPWWEAKVVTAVLLTAILLITLTALVVCFGLIHGWELTLRPTGFTETDTAKMIHIHGVSPLVHSLIVLVLFLAAFAPVSILSMVVAAAVRRPALGYALPFVAMVAYWRFATAYVIPQSFTYRFDPIMQTYWVQHKYPFFYSWGWKGILPLWALGACCLGAFVMRRIEIAQSK